MDPFANRTELNEHLSGKDHTRLKLICLWCLGRQVFTRVNDLKQHVKTSHIVGVVSCMSDFQAGLEYWLCWCLQPYLGLKFAIA